MTKLNSFYENYLKFPLFILTHPIQGYQLFKEEKKGKMSVAIFYLVMSILVSILQYKYTGPVIGMYDQTKFNSVTMVIYIITPVIVLSVANWSITTLMDGKGKMKEIFMMLCYSFFPLVFISLINIVLSNVVTTDEAAFLGLLALIGSVCQYYMIFMGLVVIHEYGILKTVATILLTIIATLVMMFIALLIFDLSQQIYGFLYSLYYEITTRFL